jgi:RNA polymerase sigma-70 factor, ECF subfamily
MFNKKRSDFEALVRAYSAELYRYGYWLSKDRLTAEDLVQETFARAWSGWMTLRDPKAARKWLYTILRREHARTFERKRLDIVDDQDLDTLEDTRLATLSAQLEVREFLAQLPQSYHEPLLLQVVGGFTCEEIAKIMDVSRGAIMTRLSRARLALRRTSERRGGKESSA